MDDQILKAFKTLPTSTERLAVLSQIIEGLTVKELHDVLGVIYRRKDPLAILPMELIACIFNDLGIFDAWKLQKVCRQWRLSLSSTQLQRSVLSCWYTHDVLNDEAPGPCIGIEKSVESKFRHVRAFRLGAPFSTISFEASLGVRDYACCNNPLPHVALNGRRLAWIQNKREVAVRDLLTGRVHTLHGLAREELVCLVLTNSHIGFVTMNGQLYIYNLRHLDEDSGATDPDIYLLPSSRVWAIAGDADMIALEFPTSLSTTGLLGRTWTTSLTIVYCRASEHKMRVTTIGPALVEYAIKVLHSQGSAMLLNNANGSLDVFGIAEDADPDGPEHLVHFRVSLSDIVDNLRYKSQCIGWDRTSTTFSDYNCDGDILMSMRRTGGGVMLGSVQSTGYRYLYHIRQQDPVPDKSHKDSNAQMFFNARTRQITKQYHWHEPSTLHDPDSEVILTYACWKDMIIVADDVPNLFASRAVASPPRERDFTRPSVYDCSGKQMSFKTQKKLKATNYEMNVLVNDTFLVLVDAGPPTKLNPTFTADTRPYEARSSFTVWCFDEDTQMAGAESTGFWD